MAEIVAAETPGTVIPKAGAEASRYDRANDMLMNRMPELVKGAGMALPGGNKVLSDEREIFSRSYDATMALKSAVKEGISNPHGVMKGWNPNFNSQFGLFQAALGAPQVNAQSAIQDLVGQLNTELGKNFSIGGFTNTSVTGLVPYDLVAPSRLIYPVYSPLRNKIARVPGQGTSRQAKIITGISGSQTDGGSANGGGTGAFTDISITETNPTGAYPQTSSLPPNGSQSEVDINVAYKFFGLTESLSWLAQFSGQGFEDISALANLILLQEFMLNEEAQIIAGTSTAVVAPTATVTTAVRTAGTGEVGMSGSNANVAVVVSAANYFGETASNATFSTNVAANAGQVVDVTIPGSLPAGALGWNIYVSTNASPLRANAFRIASNVGGVRFTIQGPTLPTTGPVAQSADTGTFKATRMPGLIPVLTGQAAANGMYGTAAQTAGWSAGYYQPNTQTHLSISSVNRMLAGLWDGDATYGNTVAGAFRADPVELIGEGSDIMNLSNDLVQSGTATNYRLQIDVPDVSGLRAGAAVSEFQNPITRSVLRLLVHPWWPQGTVVAMSYSLPFSWSNVNNVWEMTMVQDYVSVSWPVIDPTFRYSMFMYGSLVCNAPQYCGIMQGLQKSDVTPYA